MQRFLPLMLVSLTAGCTMSPSPEPGLAPRAAEEIDPRLPIPDAVDPRPVDPALVQRLSEYVSAVRSGAPQFEAREAEASRLAASAGPMASESWVAAQQALSLLVEQYGVTTRAAAEIDALAAGRLQSQHWIRPADRQAIADAAAEVDRISSSQFAAINRLTGQLAR